MAFPRQSFREVGLFSTAFGLKGRSLLYYDEIELCYRLERRGWRILYAPNAVVNHAIHPERLTPAWFRQRFYSQGKTEAYFDLVHCGRRRVAERLIRSGRLALTEAVCSGPASRAIDLSRLCRIWVSLGYGVGAVQGWMTGVSRRARPAPYDGPNLAHRARGSVAVPSPPLKASIVIPSKNGGELFALALER